VIDITGTCIITGTVICDDTDDTDETGEEENRDKDQQLAMRKFLA